MVKRLTWPNEPYRGLAYYGAEHALLFAGREDDVDDCVQLLADSQTRMLLLHGRTGCGKSSFLRAGLIPALEEKGFGYQFLRGPGSEQYPEGLPVFIRCGRDPISRIAEEVFRFASRPYVTATATGPMEFDLSPALLGHTAIGTFLDATANPSVLLSAVSALSRILLHTLVIILDQAEEVIALTKADDERRRRFFHFLQGFNAIGPNLRFVVALRRDHFGDFFNYLQVDASVKTADVKHFLLLDLEYEDVLRAIELPTDRKPYLDHGRPHDRYRFIFQNGLAKEIADDLFAAVPAGGVLLAMQIVCQDLYREIRDRPEPRVIDRQRYRAGGRIAGRVSRHISDALQAAFVDARLGLDERKMEEGRWRKALNGLVVHEADGTVKTDVVTADRLQLFFREAGVTIDPARVLDVLVADDRVILRRFSVLNTSASREEVSYSLGHDAIGLALHEWKLREDAAERQQQQHAAEQQHLRAQQEKRLDSEKRKRRRLVVGLAAAGLTALVAISTLFVQSYVNNMHNLRFRVNVLTSAAERLKATDYKLSLWVAVQAVLEAKQERWLPSGSEEAVAALANVLASGPKQLVEPSIDMSKPDSQVIILPNSNAFLFVSWPDVMELIGLDRNLRREMEMSDIVDLSKWTQPYLKKTVEMKGGLVSFLFGDTTPPDMPDNYEVIVTKDWRVVHRYTRDQFVSLSPAIRLLTKPDDPDSAGLMVSQAGDMVYLIWSKPLGADGFALVVDSFVLDEAADGGFRHISSVPKHEYNHLNRMSLLDGFVALQEGSRTAPQDSSSSSRSQSRVADRRSNMAGILDLQTTEDLWKALSTKDDILKNCPTDTSRDSETTCLIEDVTRIEQNTTPFVLRVTKSGDSLTRNDNGNAQEKDDTSSLDELVLLFPEAKITVDVDLVQLRKLRRPEGSTRATSTTPDRQTQPLVSGTPDNLVIGLTERGAVDVYRIVKGTHSFVGTFAAAGALDKLRLSSDGNMLLGTDGKVGIMWDISTPIPDFREHPPTVSWRDLVGLACHSGLLKTAPNERVWRFETGLFDPPPPPPC